MTLADGSYWVYAYDDLGQVVSGKRYWNDGTPVAGQQFEYGFDDIGNRTDTAAGGDEDGENLRAATYTSNNVNQYSQRTVPGAIDVFGIANSAATVTVESASTYRRGGYFYKEVSVSNGGAAVYQEIDILATEGVNSVPDSGHAFVPKTAETYSHDTDGNLLYDGRWDYVWDGENRLAKMRSRSGSPAPERRIELEYDWMGRRIRKTVYDDRDDGQGTTLSDKIYLYDGWNMIAELNSSQGLVASFGWGLDLSGSVQGAGGVGGFLWRRSAGGVAQFAAYDGNGNVTGLVAGNNGTGTANYEYGPFGESMRVNGTEAGNNPFRFSSKYEDSESGHLYYG